FRRRRRQDRLHLVDGILIALLNIDEVIQVIRTSDDSAAAKRRLRAVFDLSEVQVQYILDTPLRRLTRYDRLELESEQETLRAEIAELTEILDNEDKLKSLVSGEMADLAKKFGTPRRTALMEAGATVTAAVPLEVTDDPCLVVLSATGLLARVPATVNDEAERLAGSRDPAAGIPGGAGAADLVASSVATTARATIGAVTSAGRMIRVSVIEIPPCSASAASPGTALSAGHPVEEFVPGLADGETVLALASLDGGESSGVALGTASGIVKRVQPDYPANRDEFELIALKDDDRVVGAAYLSGDDAELVFITSDAQLLRFAADSVRPQGRAATGMAGVRLSDGVTAIWFCAVGPAATRSVRPALPASPQGGPADNHEAAMAAMADLRAELTGEEPGASGVWATSAGAAEAVVVTIAGRSGALPGAGGASVKVTPFAEYPPKGRATGGVRCQRFLKGEDGLTRAWIGPSPVIGVTESGIVVDLSGMTGRRDGSGNAITRQLAHVGHPFLLS
ncbi:MAG: DNA gyrase subunit A, partial [Trebonia sp.]